ncbi:hypothetical protein [Methylocystis sp. B8]|uniref:hypothetical protein n=1 Tax=Methylocystis sp. B8 TaxID=544938 RepID=UPI0010FD80FA|nr:hypothetical protein [Methylocystis sp. B8]TLG78817.1 hypothetical protein FEV16_01900 [Methylocystis sp. B8]
MSMLKKFVSMSLAAAIMVGATASATPAFAWSKWHHGYGWAPFAVGGALALGAMAAAASGPDCYYERRPIFNRWGDVIGYRSVPVC